jgi:hypothetical protein
VLLLLIGGAGFAAYRLVSPRVRTQVADRARKLIDEANLDALADAARKHARAADPRPRAADPPPVAPPPVERDRERPPVVAERPSPRPEPRERVTIRLVTRPAGASVMGARGRLGRTPLPYTTRPGASEVLRFAKPGYASTSRRITAGPRSRTVVVELRRKRR